MGCSADATLAYGYVFEVEVGLDDLSPLFTEEQVTNGEDYDVVMELGRKHGCELGYAGNTQYNVNQIYIYVIESQRHTHWGADFIELPHDDHLAWNGPLQRFAEALQLDLTQAVNGTAGWILAADYG